MERAGPLTIGLIGEHDVPYPLPRRINEDGLTKFFHRSDSMSARAAFVTSARRSDAVSCAAKTGESSTCNRHRRHATRSAASDLVLFGGNHHDPSGHERSCVVRERDSLKTSFAAVLLIALPALAQERHRLIVQFKEPPAARQVSASGTSAYSSAFARSAMTSQPSKVPPRLRSRRGRASVASSSGHFME